MSVAQDDPGPAGFGALEVALDVVDLLLFDEARPDVVAERREEREDHAAADEEVVRAGDEVVDDAELVGDLRPAEDDGEGARRIVEEPVAHFDLGLDERSCVVREELGEFVHRRLLAMDDAEAVGDEVVGESGESPGELAPLGFVLRRLPGLKRRFSSRSTSPSPSSATFAFASSPTVSEAKATSRPIASASSPATGASEKCGSGSPLGRPEVGDDDHSGSRLGE